jgi:ABC-2 type transport system permease protein
MLFGWAVGLFTAALILRFGQAAEALVWGVPFVLQPFSAVFYPVDAMPGWARAAALTLPSTHVFEGMRAVLSGEGVRGATLATAFSLNALYLGAGAAFFGWMLKRVREKGYLGKLGME